MIEIETEDENNSEDLIDKNENLKNITLKKTLSFNEILCTAILFFTAGYETTTTTLCFLAYNLAMNQECQEKLCKEIDHMLEKYVRFKAI